MTFLLLSLTFFFAFADECVKIESFYYYIVDVFWVQHERKLAIRAGRSGGLAKLGLFSWEIGHARQSKCLKYLTWNTVISRESLRIQNDYSDSSDFLIRRVLLHIHPTTQFSRRWNFLNHSDVLFSECPNSSDFLSFLGSPNFHSVIIFRARDNTKSRSRSRKLLFLTRAVASSLVDRENKCVFILSFYFSWRNPAISNCIRHIGFYDQFSFASHAESCHIYNSKWWRALIIIPVSIWRKLYCESYKRIFFPTASEIKLQVFVAMFSKAARFLRRTHD